MSSRRPQRTIEEIREEELARWRTSESTLANPPYGQFLVIEFEDGTKKAGVFTEDSIALTSPEPHGLFLASEWEIDEAGNIMSEVPGTAGVTLLGTRGIRSIRILEPGEEDGENGE